MCGIFGYIKPNRVYQWPKAKETLYDLVYMTQLRGLDALGMFKARHKADDFAHSSIKRVGQPMTLLHKNEDVKKFIGDDLGHNQFFVGHCRLATKGAKEIEANAHPYTVKKANGKGSIVLVHNGTISHFGSNLDKEFPGKTDSHTLAQIIASEKLTLSEIDDECWGAYALVWYDSEHNSLNFFKNSLRPFGIVYTEKDDIWFGSEIYTVAAAVERRRENHVDDLKKLPNYEHWTYHLTENKWDKEVVPLKVRKSSSTSSSSKITAANSVFGEEEEGTLQDKFLNYEERGDIFTEEQGDELPFAADVVPGKDAPLLGVIPYVPPNTQGGPFRPSSTRKPPSWATGRASREKWRPVEEHNGYKKGDKITFALNNCVAMDRSTQTQIVGTLITFSAKNSPQMLGHENIVGMMGMNIVDVDKVRNFLEGEVALVEMCGYTSNAKYRWVVKHIKETNIPDKFFDLNHLLHKDEPVVDSSTVGEGIQILPPALPNTIFDIKKQYSLLRRCDSCDEAGPVAKMNRARQGDDGTTIYICAKCSPELLGNDARLQKMFDLARVANINALLNANEVETRTLQ